MKLRNQWAARVFLSKRLESRQRRVSLQFVKVESLLCFVSVFRFSMIAHELVVGGRTVLLESVMPRPTGAASDGQ
jgi:hypothetical protein